MTYNNGGNLGVPGTFSDVDMFLQTLTSEESSDTDSYDFFSPESRRMQSQFYGLPDMGVMKSQLDSFPQSAFDPMHVSNSKNESSVGKELNNEVRQGRGLENGEGVFFQDFQSSNFGAESRPLDHVNSYGSSSISSNSYPVSQNRSPLDINEDKLRKPFPGGNNEMVSDSCAMKDRPNCETNYEAVLQNNIGSDNNIGVKKEVMNLGSGNMDEVNETQSSSPLGSRDFFSMQDRSVIEKSLKPKKERTSHNVIEKKYRTNINNKIVKLKEIIPSLCITMKREEGIPITDSDVRRLDGLQPAKKLNKASILVKTIEYIQHLENKMEVLQQENDQLKQTQSFSTPLSVRNNSTSDHTSDSTSNVQSDIYPCPNIAEAYPSSDNSTSLTNKMLMGGLAMTMGLNCFSGEGNDLHNVKGLLAVPALHYSPIDGFSLSNSNGVINIYSALLSVFRIVLWFASVAHLFSLFINFKKADKSKNSGDISGIIVPFSDTLKFDCNSNINETLKKTLFFNRIKYPENSVERFENDIAKCFAITLWDSHLKIFFRGYVDRTWKSLRHKVSLINRNKQKIENKDWSAITNILSEPTSKTLNDNVILSALKKNTHGISLSDLVLQINKTILNQKLESIINDMIDKSLEKDNNGFIQKDPVKKLYLQKIKGNKEFESIGISETLLCIFEPSEKNIKNFSSIIMKDDKIKENGSSKDSILILISSIIQNLVQRRNFYEVAHWIRKLPVNSINNDCNILSMFSLFMTLQTLLLNLENIPDMCHVSSKLEVLSGTLRIWVGSDCANILDFNTRGALVDSLVEAAMKFNSLIQNEAEIESDYESDDSFFIEDKDGNESEDDHERLYNSDSDNKDEEQTL